jgi:hypothetical protein
MSAQMDSNNASRERPIRRAEEPKRLAGGYNRALYSAEKRQALDRWAEHVTALATQKPPIAFFTGACVVSQTSPSFVLESDSIDRILKAVRGNRRTNKAVPPSINRDGLASDLQGARALMDIKGRWATHSQTKTLFQSLYTTASAFQCAMRAFRKKDEPGLGLLRIAAKEHARRLACDIETLNSEISALRRQIARLERSDASDSGIEPAVAQIEIKKQQLSMADHRFQRYRPSFDDEFGLDIAPEEILAATMDGVDLILEWLALSTNEPGSAQMTPETWFIVVALPSIFWEHFGRSVARSRNEFGDLGGPSLRFAEAVLIEFGIKSPKTGKPLSRAGIEDLWGRYGVVGNIGDKSRK